jgi:hypothetical protein
MRGSNEPRPQKLTSHPQGGVLKAEAEGWSVLKGA